MTAYDRWVLPAGIEELLPAQAEWLEGKRRAVLDLYHSWGYELIIPPFIEYLESLLVGSGRDLDLQTFTLTDQLNGRTMGVRADMTPQAARIDAHRLGREAPTRLCYMGTVLHTLPVGPTGARSLLQIGAELFGHAGVDSDLEILQLMLQTLQVCEIEQVHVDLGHVAVYRELLERAQLTDEQEELLHDRLLHKAVPDIENLLSQWDVAPPVRDNLIALSRLQGEADVLDRARHELAWLGQGIDAALTELAQLADRLRRASAQVTVNFDLGELSGYHYHTGMVFTAYVPGEGQEIARGGRYDHIGEAFGRARPATGFSINLKDLMRVTGNEAHLPACDAIFAPWADDPSLAETIAALRAAGERVVCELRGQTGDAKALGCRRRLSQQAGVWTVLENE